MEFPHYRDFPYYANFFTMGFPYYGDFKYETANYVLEMCICVFVYMCIDVY